MPESGVWNAVNAPESVRNANQHPLWNANANRVVYDNDTDTISSI